MLMCIRVCGLQAHLVYLYSTLTCTTHFAFYIKGTHVYSIIREMQYTYSVFLTWYQSHCSNFIVSCSLVLSVFSAASTSVISKPFQCPWVESPSPEAPPPPPKPLPSSDLSPLSSDQDIRNITVYYFNPSTQCRRKLPHLIIHAPPRAGQSFYKIIHAPHAPSTLLRSCCHRLYRNLLSPIYIVGEEPASSDISRALMRRLNFTAT